MSVSHNLRFSLALALGLAVSAAALVGGLGGCGSRHSGFHGYIAGERISASLLAVPEGGGELGLSGTVLLSAGSARVSLIAPDGSLAWEGLYERGGEAGGARTFTLGYAKAASPGAWTVRVQGEDEASAGSYAISLDLR
jgi:hypothetical protein